MESGGSGVADRSNLDGDSSVTDESNGLDGYISRSHER